MGEFHSPDEGSSRNEEIRTQEIEDPASMRIPSDTTICERVDTSLSQEALPKIPTWTPIAKEVTDDHESARPGVTRQKYLSGVDDEPCRCDVELGQQGSRGESAPTTIDSAQDPTEPSRSTLQQVAFILVTGSAQLLAQAQFGSVLVPLVEIGRSLGTSASGELGWMAASYGVTIGMFLVASGRLGDFYGSKKFWTIGYILIIASNIGSGFCTSPIPFDICRALSGVGVALSLPNAVAILGRAYPPGRTRSMIFAGLGSLGPAGFLFGGALGALFAVKVGVSWIWWFTAILAAFFLVGGILLIPKDPPAHNHRPFDFLGAALLSAALGLFNFAWNQAALVGWEQPYVYVILIVSIVIGTAFYFWERRIGRNALIPVQVLSRTSLLVYLSLWMGWMSLGIFLFYTSLFIRNVKGASNALVVAAQMSPVAPAGIIAALAVPAAISRFRGHHIFLVSMIAFFIGCLMASLTPINGSYWSVTFPSLILVIAGPDLSFATGQLIVSNSVSAEFQGVAGGIVAMLTNYSLSIGLGMAGTVERYVVLQRERAGDDAVDTMVLGYRSALWFGTALGVLAVVVVGGFVRMPKEKHGTV